MRNWFKKKLSSDYVRRQIYMMSSLGLFYIIIIALFAIPLLGAFVVVLIQGVMDFRYLILGAGIVLAGLAIFYGGKWILRFFGQVRQDGLLALGDARGRSREGEPVQIDLFNGLLTFSYGGNRRTPGLPPPPGEALRRITDGSGEPEPPGDPVWRLRELSKLRDEGIIEADEFQRIKARLIRNFCESEKENPSPLPEK